MNHVYKVVFNRALGVYQCVSEIAKSQGKSSGKSATSGSKSAFNLTTLFVAMFGVLGSNIAISADSIDLIIDQGQTIELFDEEKIGSDHNLIIDNNSKILIPDNSKKSGIIVSNNAIIGDNSNGSIEMKATDEPESDYYYHGLNVYGNTILGNKLSSKGSLIISGLRNYQTENLIVGNQGEGNVLIENTPYYGGLTKALDTTYIGGYGPESTQAKGEFTLSDSTYVTPKMIVGNTGSGILRLYDVGELETEYVGRNSNSIKSEIYVNGGGIAIESDEKLLFENFTENNKIHFGQKGGYILTEMPQYGGDDAAKPISVKVDPKAVITGDVGKFDISLADEYDIGGFIKSGVGSLELTTYNKQWTGDWGSIGGVLKLEGDYTMPEGESLIIGLVDVNENGHVDDNEYGQIEVEGNLDINKGNLKVYVGGYLDNITTNKEYKNVVKANRLDGKFKKVVDNSPLISLQADYSDANAVHLKMVSPEATPVDPTPEPTPKPDDQIYIGKKEGSNELVNVDDDYGVHGLRTESNIHVGYAGTGNLNIFKSGASAKNILVGSLSSGLGTITIDGNKGENSSDLITKNLIIGDSGQGKLITQNHQDEEGWYDTSVETTNAIIGNKAGSKGELYVEDSTIEIENELVVGNQGSGSFIASNSIIELADIRRNPNSQGSTVEFDGVSLWTTKANNNLFSGFDSSTPIILKSNGMVIANDKDYTSENGDVTNFDIKINPEAVFKGNVGSINPNLIEGDLLGGFIKAGKGLVEISDKSMQWEGDTSVIDGTLRVIGNFTLNEGEKLGIGILEPDDWDDSEDYDEYIKNKPTTLAGVNSGKLEVTGTADISKGSLFIHADEAIKGTAEGTVWKDAVTAGNLVGKFKKVEDNSPLVTFYADYSDSNKVHITLTEPTSGETGNETGSDTGNETGGETGNETGGETGNETSGEAGNETGGETGNETSGETGNETSGETGNETSGETGNETGSDTGNETSGETGNETGGETENETSGETGNETGGETGNEAGGETGNEAGGETGNETSGETGNETSGETGNETGGDTENETSGETGNETGGETGNETGGDTETNDIKFVSAVNFGNNRSALGLASVLDESIADIKAENTLATALLADILIADSEEDDLRKTKVAISAEQLQPLFMGGANRLITDSNYATTNAISEHSQTTPERNLWAKAIGSDMTHDADGYVTGYNSENYGAIVGLDMPINPDLNLGVAVSYIESDADTDGHALNHELEAKNWQVLGYGNYAASEATSINFHAGAGQSSVDGERHIQLPSSLTAKSDYDVDTMQAGFGVSHQLGTETRNVAPFASFNYARAESDGYSETGAGAYNLTVDENTYESMRWTAGLRFNQALTPTVSVTGQLAGAIENGDSYSDITASFTEVGSNKFYTQGQESKEAIGIAGIGLAFKPTANTTISANYNGEWRDNYDDQGAAIVFETKF